MMKKKQPEVFTVEGALLVALMLFLTLAFFSSHGSSDVDRFWLFWMTVLSDNATFRQGFEGIWADYPPLSILVLYGIKEIAPLLHVDVFVVLKFSVLVCLLTTTFLYYWLSRCLVTTLLMHVMFMLSSIMLTYLDIYYAPLLLLSVWALYKNKPWLASILFVVCCTIKYQPLIIAPFFAIYLWKLHQAEGDHAIGKTLKTIVIPAGIAFVAMYLLVGWPLFTSFYNALFHSRLSFQALNLYWVYVQGMITFAGVEERAIRGASMVVVYATRLVFATFYLALLWKFIKDGKNFRDFLLFAIAGFYSYFILVSGVHENHLFIAAVLASVLYIVDERYKVVALFVMLMSNINLLIFNGISGGDLPFSPVFFIDMTIPIALLNSVFYFFVFYLLLTNRYLRAEK